MESRGSKTQFWPFTNLRRASWPIAVLLLLLTLAGCLTTHAAGPMEKASSLPATELPQLTHTAIATPTTMPGVTLVPNLVVHVLQATSTATATATATPTDVPDTATPTPTETPGPTETRQPTDTPAPTRTAPPRLPRVP